MPIYAFKCSKCGHEFDELVPRMDAVAPCPECGSKKVARQLTAPAAYTGSSAAAEVPPCATGGGCAGGACPFG
jgi:putative FmdB family regulatory protein